MTTMCMKTWTSLAHLVYVLALILLPASPANAREILRIAAWAGYADADLVKAFEQRLQVEVEVTLVNSDDDLWEKINSNTFDVFAVNTAELQRYIAHNKVAPLDLTHIPNHAGQLPRFQKLTEIPGLIHGDQLYALPYTYAEMGLIYNRKLVKETPQSMAALWDPRYRGQVLAFNASNHNFSLVALLMGFDPFQITDAQLEQAAQKLVSLRRNVLTFYATAEEAVNLFTRYEIALIFGNYGSQQVKALREAGADIGYVIPEEGALAWLDCWAVTTHAPNKALAAQWIDYTLESAVSRRLTEKHGLANTVIPFPDSTPADKLIWLQPLREPIKRKQLWERILSGEPPEAF